MKQCLQCKETKSLSEFFKNKLRKDGLGAYCKLCHRKRINDYRLQHPEKERAIKRKYYLKYKEQIKAENRTRYHNNKEQRRNSVTIHLYGISLAEKNKMLTAQGGVCALCKEIPKKQCVDHDHVTGKVRAVLCHHCNLAIGHARENPELLIRMSNYLQQHRGLVPVDVLSDESDAGWIN